MTHSLIIALTDDSFQQEVLEAEHSVLVDFWAEWCGPCKQIAPILDELAVEYDERLKICKLNVDKNEKTASKYGIRSIPTLMIFQAGSAKAHKIGGISKSALKSFLDEHLK